MTSYDVASDILLALCAGTPGLAPPSSIKKKSGKPPGLLAASAAKKSGKQRPPQNVEEPETADSLMGESSWSDQERSQFLAALAAHGGAVQLETRVESAWFQRFKLLFHTLLSLFA